MKSRTFLNLIFCMLGVMLFTSQLNAQDHEYCGFDHLNEAKAQQDPEFRRGLEDYITRVLPQLARTQTFNSRGPNTIYVPVVVHVIHEAGEAIGTGSNLLKGRIEAQIEEMNKDFSATNDAFANTPARWADIVGNPDIQFCLAAIDPNGDPTDGITRHAMTVIGSTWQNSNINSDIKPATYWNSNLYFNIWTLPIPGTSAGGGVTGFAGLPSGGQVGSQTDGAVVDWRWFGGPGYGQSGYGTLTHEAGHYLGLYHPFNGNSCSADDGISDTPNQGAPTSSSSPNPSCSNGSYPTGPNTCGEEHMYINFMDYARGSCQNSFSKEQIAVMRAVLLGNPNVLNWASRENLSNNALSACTFYDNDASVAALQSPSNLICDDGMISPIITLTNFGFQTLNTVTIEYTVNGGMPIATNWVDVLESGGSTTVTLDPFSPPAGTIDLVFYTTNPNGQPDEQTINDTLITQSVSIMPEALPLYDDFESMDFDPTPNGMYVKDITGDGITWERGQFISAYAMGGGSAMFDNYFSSSSVRGTEDHLLTPTYDFTNVTDGKLILDIAYGPFNDGNGNSGYDTLKIAVSTDCATTFNTIVYQKGGTELATVPESPSAFFPFADQWRRDTIDLSAYDGEQNVTIAFINKSDYGNRLFLDNINISPPCSMTVSEDKADVLCLGNCNGTIKLTPDGGEAPYRYDWQGIAGPDTMSRVTDLCPGNYMVTIYDSGGCSIEKEVTIGEPADLELTITPTDLNCNGDASGTAAVAALGGTVMADYQYLWSDPLGQTTATATGLSGGTYTVTVTDDNECSATIFTSITEPSAIELVPNSVDLACNGDATGIASVTASGGNVAVQYQYLWSDPLGQTTSSATGLSGGTYTVTVTDDSNCTNQQEVTIEEPEALQVEATSSTLLCFGQNDATATADVGGGTVAGDYQYLWSDPLGQTTAMATGLGAGTFTVVITDDNSCTAQASVTLAAPTELTLTGTTTDPGCNGGTGTATVIANGGTIAGADYQYLWSDPLGQNTATATGLAAGIYTVTVTDNNDCSKSIALTINDVGGISLQASSTDIECNGEASGTATVVASGGTIALDYQYLWSDPLAQMTATATGLSGGIYIVTVTDDNGCTSLTEVNVEEPTVLENELSEVDASCFGSNDGVVTVTPAGGTTPYTYDFGSGGTSNSVNTSLSAGIYMVTVTDGNGCSVTSSYTIDEPAALSLTHTPTPPSCDGISDACIEIVGTGGTNPYVYDIGSGNVSNPKFTDLSAGNYIVTVTDDNGCTSTEIVDLIAPEPIELITSFVEATCSQANGSATVDASGGTVNSDYQYMWSDPLGQTTSTATGLSAGVYIVTVTDNNQCTAITEVLVDSPPDLVLITSTTDVSGVGLNDGTATATPSGGSPGYTYSWSDPLGQTTQIATGLAPGNYMVTVTDDNGCSISETITINSFNCGGYSLVVMPSDVSCAGGNDGSAMANPANGNDPYEYAWSVPGQTGASINMLVAGTYTVTVSDQNGCDLVEEFTINEPAPLEAGAENIDPACFGNNDGEITVFPDGGTTPYEYQWSSNVGSSSGPTATSLSGGTYTVTITDENGCSIIRTETIDEPAEIDITASATNETTAGNNDGTATAGASGGTGNLTYNWSNMQSGTMITGLAPGTYTVTVTDENDCINTATVTVNAGGANCAGFGAAVSTTSISCNSAADGSATADPSGGEGPYEFLWNNMAISQTITGLSGGTYTVIVTDINGCSTTIETNVEEPEDISLSASATDETSAGNNDGTATAGAMGGTGTLSYQWSNMQSGPMITGLAPGTYTVTVTDENQCTKTTTVTVNAGGVNCAGFAAQAGAFDVTCNGENDGMAGVQASGGEAPYTFTWSNMQTGQGITGLAPGTYTVTVSDANSCLTVQTVEVDEPAELELDPGTEPASCNGVADGEASVSVTGGVGQYDYLWSNMQTGSMINGLAAGNYTVTVTDENECQKTMTITIEQPPAITVIASSTDETMSGANDGSATASANGGTGNLSYQWSNMQTGQMINGLSAGTYTVTVTDENNCTQIETVTVNPGGANCAGFGANIVATDISCNGASDGEATAAALNGEGPFDYVWNNQQMTATITGLSAGTYTVTVSDANSCITIQEIVIEEPAAITLTANATDETNAGANDGTATANANGGTGNLNYQWSNMQTGAMIDGLMPGTYTVTVTDENGCTEVAEVNVNSGMNNCAGFGSDVSSEDVSCFGAADGTAGTNPFGGNDPYDFVWSNNMTSSSITGLSAGVYTVTITDVNDCEIVEEITINEPAELRITLSGNDGACGGNASAVATPSGGVGDYTYLWNTGAIENFIADLAAGTYTVTVTDENGCSNTNEVAVDVVPGGVSADGFVEGVSCFGEADGSIDLDLLEGTPPFTFQWSNGETTEDLDSLTAGNYTVFVRDSAGCSYLTTFNVNSPAEFGVGFSTSPPSNANGDNGQIAANVFGGTAPYSYQWSTGSTSIFITDLSVGIYYLTVTDANNCISIDSVNLTLVAIQELESLESLLLFPNPTRDELTVLAEFNAIEDLEVEVFNLLGQQVFFHEERTQQLNLQLHLSGHAVGTYLLRIRTDEGQVVRKVVLVE